MVTTKHLSAGTRFNVATAGSALAAGALAFFPAVRRTLGVKRFSIASGLLLGSLYLAKRSADRTKRRALA